MKKNAERRWVELCAQAGTAKGSEERARILKELVDLLVEKEKYIRHQREKKKPPRTARPPGGL